MSAARQAHETDIATATRQAVSQIAEDTKDAAQDLKSKVTPMLNSARDKAMQMGQQLKDRAKDNALVVDRYVHDNPWSFIGLGIVTGFLASWYLMRRDR